MQNIKGEIAESIKNNEFREDLIIKLATKLIDERNFNKEVIAIQKANLGINTCGRYLFDKKVILLNPIYIKNISVIDNYISNFQIIFHELRHIEQKRIIKDAMWLIDNRDKVLQKEELSKIKYAFALSYEPESLFNKKTYYHRKHDYFPFEHEANFYGMDEAIKLLLELFPNIKNDKKTINFYNYVMLSTLIDGYTLFFNKLVSPFEKIKKYYLYSELKETKYLSLFEKLTLGLPVDKNLYLNILNDIKSNKNIPDFDSYIKTLK